MLGACGGCWAGDLPTIQWDRGYRCCGETWCSGPEAAVDPLLRFDGRAGLPTWKPSCSDLLEPGRAVLDDLKLTPEMITDCLLS